MYVVIPGTEMYVGLPGPPHTNIDSLGMEYVQVIIVFCFCGIELSTHAQT